MLSMKEKEKRKKKKETGHLNMFFVIFSNLLPTE